MGADCDGVSPLFTTLILPCGMSVENAGKGFELPHEQESAANLVKNSYNETGEPPVEKPVGPSTPNVVLHEEEDGHFQVVASGEEAIEKYNDLYKEKAHRIPVRPDGKVELTHEMDTDDEKISSIPFLEFIHLNRMF